MELKAHFLSPSDKTIPTSRTANDPQHAIQKLKIFVSRQKNEAFRAAKSAVLLLQLFIFRIKLHLSKQTVVTGLASSNSQSEKVKMRIADLQTHGVNLGPLTLVSDIADPG